MKKILITTAMASLLLSFTASADWATGNSTVFAVNHGEAAFHTSLSSEQRLDAGMTVGDKGSADIIFSMESSKGGLSLPAVPVKLISGTNADGTTYKDAKLTITPLVSTANGRRFYLMETGTLEGAKIITYSKGTFTVVFDGSSIGEEADHASFDVSKKKLVLKLEKEGTVQEYTLIYDKKTEIFSINTTV